MSGMTPAEQAVAAEAERRQAVQERALARSVAPGGPPLIAPAVGPSLKTQQGVSIVVQTTTVIPFRQMLRATGPGGKPQVSDEDLGAYWDEVNLEMGRRGLKR